MKPGEKERSVLIIANGDPPDDRLLSDLLVKSGIIIAADGGSNLCYQKQIDPDYIIGDLDSIKPEVKQYFKNTQMIEQSDQSYHDLYKAIVFARSLRPAVIRATAVLGKRFDHSMANLLLLQSQDDQIPIEFYDNYGKLTLIPHDTQINIAPGTVISLFSFLPVYGVSLNGFKYSLTNKDFPNGFNGLSNMIVSKTANISVKKGSLFLYTTNEYD